MLILRVIAILSAIAVIGSLLAWAMTRNPRYLRFAGRIAKSALFVALAILVLLAAERLLVL